MPMHIHRKDFEAVGPSVGDQGYMPVSFWQETVSVSPNRPLEDSLSCDVVILGGGYTGLSTAYELKRSRPDLDVVILEKEVVGHGASGRNGGFVMPLLGWNLAHCINKLGRAKAREAYQTMYAAVDHTVDIIRREAIDCDLEETGYLLLATSTRGEKHVAEEAALGDALGFGYRHLRGDELAEHVIGDGFRSGCFDPHTAIVNPAKLARGLKERVEALGVQIYEQSAAESVSSEGGVLVTTASGSVRARAGLLALNGYGPSMGFMRTKVVNAHTFIVLTEPLSDAQLRSIGWGNKRTSLETSRNFIHYLRLTADNRIAFGGNDATVYWSCRFEDRDEKIFAGLEKAFRSFFPGLADVSITHRWGGPIGITLDMFPSFGEVPRYKGLFHAGAYCGHGVSLANYAGRIMAPAILESLGLDNTPTSAPVRFGRAPFYVGHGPIRFVGMHAYRAALHAADRLLHR